MDIEDLSVIADHCIDARSRLKAEDPDGGKLRLLLDLALLEVGHMIAARTVARASDRPVRERSRA